MHKNREFTVYASSDKIMILPKFLSDDIGCNNHSQSMSIIAGKSESLELTGKITDIKRNGNVVTIAIDHKNGLICDYLAQFLLKIMKEWLIIHKKHNKSSVELAIDWENQTFSFTPLENWVDPLKEQNKTHLDELVE